MSSFERFAAFSQWCEGPGAAFGTSSASAEKSRATPPIPNANTEAVPRINFLIIVISRVAQVSKIVELLFKTVSPQSAFPRVAVSYLRQGGTGLRGKNRMGSPLPHQPLDFTAQFNCIVRRGSGVTRLEKGNGEG
jgi:hypothetical protein